MVKRQKDLDECSVISDEHKPVGTVGNTANEQDMNFYLIEFEMRIIIVNGDCSQESTFEL